MNTTITSVAKEAGNTTSTGNNKAHSDRRSRKNKYSSKKSGAGTRNRVAEEGSLYYRYR